MSLHIHIQLHVQLPHLQNTSKRIRPRSPGFQCPAAPVSTDARACKFGVERTPLPSVVSFTSACHTRSGYSSNHISSKVWPACLPEDTGTLRVERFDRRGTEPFEPFEPFEFFQNRNFPEFLLRKLKKFRKFQHFLNYRRNSDKISSKSEQKSVKRIHKKRNLQFFSFFNSFR